MILKEKSMLLMYSKHALRWWSAQRFAKRAGNITPITPPPPTFRKSDYSYKLSLHRFVEKKLKGISS